MDSLQVPYGSRSKISPSRANPLDILLQKFISMRTLLQENPFELWKN